MEEHIEKHLRGRRILNINSRSLIDPDNDPPAPGVPPTASNQGQSSVCSSHAVGKGVVDLLDGLQLDCDQDQVIKTLIKTFQPHEFPIPIDCFHNKQFEVEIWKNDRNSKQSFPLKIWIQRQKVVDVQNWNGPLIGDRERKEHHMGLVGVWSVGLDDYHAMYVTKCKKGEKGGDGYVFEFLNSWGTDDANTAKVLQMFNAQIDLFNSRLTDLYYISLYSSNKPHGIRNMAPQQTTPSSAGAAAIAPQGDKSVVILSSQGNACEEGGVVTLLGIYEEQGIYCESKYYTQMHTLDGDQGFIFRHQEDPKPWVVATSLETPLKDCKLKAVGGTGDTPPASGWKYKTKKESIWIADHQFKVEMRNQLPEFKSVTFTCTNPDLSLNIFGTYKPHLDFFSHGRQVFKHEKEELFLFVANESVAWSVRDSLKSRFALMHSACAPSLSPADPRAARSRNRKQWECKLAREWIRDAGIKVSE